MRGEDGLCEETISDMDQDTFVSDFSETLAATDHRTDAFLALIRRQIAKHALTVSHLAASLGVSRRQLGRMLGGDRPLRISELGTITQLLGIDLARAAIAIEIFGDWQSYDDPGLVVLMQLMLPVITRLREGAQFQIEPLTETGKNRLSDWLAKIIITNEEQVRSRRDDFVKLPEL